MKNIMFLCMGVLMLGLFSCEKEVMDDSSQGPEVQMRRAVAKAACPTALMIQGMTPSTATCSVTDLNTSQNVVTFSNGTAYITLSTSSSYFVDIQGPSPATFTWCSCGPNNGSVTIQPGSWYILNTSSSTSPYTICSF